MSFSDPESFQDNSFLNFTLVVAMLGCFGFLALGPGFENEYAGFGALIALPMCFGALLTLGSGSYSPLGCLIAPIALGLLCYTLVLLGLEGMVCVVMVMPIWFLAGLGGGLVALFVLRRQAAERDGGGASVNSVGLAVLPFLLIYAETAAPPAWDARTVTRSVTIAAPAERIWPLLVSIPKVDASEGIATFTHDWLGIPRPSEALLVTRGDQPVRLAKWGDNARFEEVVTHIAPGHEISWDFAFPDPSLQNRVDQHVSPDGEMLKIASGSYQLETLDDGRTRVTLSTSYAMRTRFDWYFGFWGERLLGDVQDNVLAIVKDRSETAAQAAARALR
ncbi:MAG: SRPBCC family protein [Erythrobacter sp.]